MKSLRELDGDLVNHWYILALSSELKPQKPIRRTLYERPYVLFRGENGQAVVLLDQCIHRGTKLSEGVCKQGTIRCPYHGWVFDQRGQLIEVPSDGPVTEKTKSDLERRAWRVPSLPVVEREGCIWVWAGEPSLKTEGPFWFFPKYGDKGWIQYFMITDFNNEVTQLIQNFMDVPHTVYVHSGWFRSRRALKVPIHLETQGGRVKVTYKNPDDSIGFFAHMINPNKQKMFHTDEFIFPNITRVDYNFGNEGFIVNSQCTPVGRYQTRVYTWIAYRGVWWINWLKPVMQFYTRRVIQQDVDIMKNQGDNLKAFQDRMPNRSTAADELHLAIEHLRQHGGQSRFLAKQPHFQREREFWI